MREAGEIVTAFIKAIETRDMANAVPWLADDVVFDNVPLAEVARLTIGATAVGERLQKLLDASERVEWEILCQIDRGSTVFVERVDRFWFPHGMFPAGDLLEWPVCSRWEVENGKITLWRDYYETNLNEPQLGVSLSEFGRRLNHDYG